MPALVYRLTLLEPAIFTALEGEPNSAVSYDFVPGSVIRGMVIGTALRQNKGGLDAADQNARRLFFSSETRYLNAYILSPIPNEEGWVRSLPVPLSWQHQKHDKRIIYDLAVSGSPADQQLKSVGGFASVNGSQAALTLINRTLNVHTVRPRRGGGEGTVYRYDALARGQVFEGIILCENNSDGEWLKTVLFEHSTSTLGGARSAGYGRVQISDVRLLTEAPEAPRFDNGNQVVVTLLSDAILRDANAQYAPSLDTLLGELSRLGLIVRAEMSVQAFLDITMVGGFNRKWGLPLPQTPALKMGSALVLQNADWDAAVLHRLQERGIGERREDGFGRIAVNWQHEVSYTASEYDRSPRHVVLPSPQGSPAVAQRLLGRIQTHLSDQSFDRNLASVFRDATYQIHGSISKTQIARLREEIADELRNTPPSPNVLLKFLRSIDGKYAADRYRRALIQGQPLEKWLRDIAANDKDEPRLLLKFVDTVLERAQQERTARNG
jgi:CRISPR-associated protein Csx10